MDSLPAILRWVGGRGGGNLHKFLKLHNLEIFFQLWELDEIGSSSYLAGIKDKKTKIKHCTPIIAITHN